MGFERDSGLRADPVDQIAPTSLAPHLHEVARDLAARLIHALRSNQRWKWPWPEPRVSTALGTSPPGSPAATHRVRTASSRLDRSSA